MQGLATYQVLWQQWISGFQMPLPWLSRRSVMAKKYIFLEECKIKFPLCYPNQGSKGPSTSYDNRNNLACTNRITRPTVYCSVWTKDR